MRERGGAADPAGALSVCAPNSSPFLAARASERALILSLRLALVTAFCCWRCATQMPRWLLGPRLHLLLQPEIPQSCRQNASERKRLVSIPVDLVHRHPQTDTILCPQLSPCRTDILARHRSSSSSSGSSSSRAGRRDPTTAGVTTHRRERLREGLIGPTERMRHTPAVGRAPIELQLAPPWLRQSSGCTRNESRARRGRPTP